MTKITWILMLWGTVSFSTQPAAFDWNKLKFRGIEVGVLSRQAVIKAFGKSRIEKAEDLCWFNEENTGQYQKLLYDGFNYLGSDKEKFILENIFFDPAGKVKLHYGQHALNGLTTYTQFLKIFGDAAKGNVEKDTIHILLQSNGGDDGALFIFTKGRLSQFQHWIGC
jgi:hypothetical protein